MKILFLNTNIGYGGASKMMTCVANYLCDSHDVHFLVFRSDEIKQQLDSRVHLEFNTLYKNRNKALENIGEIIALHRVIKKGKYDLVVAFLHPSHYMAVLASFGTKAKVLFSERVDPITRRKTSSLFVKAVQKIVEHADAFVFQSDGAMKAYPEKCQKHGRVIVNSIPKKEYPSYSPSEQKYVVSVGRMEIVQKRQDVLLEAFKIFHANHNDYRLMLVGDGPDEEKVKKIIQENGLSDCVDYMGERKDALLLVANSTMFVLSSDYEGIPNALLEAMVIGAPCISTDCSPGGARMIIDNEKNGFIVPCDNPVELAEKMALVADNDEIRNMLSENSKSKLDRFSETEVKKQWCELVNSL